ncbi:hypothetical protein C2857_004387 [Epichloe festucae Fl1]|uniref:Uncharacterized protein n=1 Tax=Epichloe festucae (strain Fl1) TaxID=877507 RepID=A0A7S9KSB3_EPIFF|nr:hypothetical protein C2857_004387 [Epichloe festucae Fl1]
MARRSTRNRSGDDSDPSVIAMEAPKRIYEAGAMARCITPDVKVELIPSTIQQLKKERDERAKAVLVQAEKALASVRQQAMAVGEENRRNWLAQNLKRVMDLVEKRKLIEARMLDVVAGVHSQMQEVEEMILAGYRGRRDEAQLSLEALSGKLPRGKG